ncbi:hypothetical protein BDN71DRAFT_1387975, partial [Pleurotus eryngii]
DDQWHLVTATDNIWDKYIDKHPSAKKWRKKVFPCYCKGTLLFSPFPLSLSLPLHFFLFLFIPRTLIYFLL